MAVACLRETGHACVGAAHDCVSPERGPHADSACAKAVRAPELQLTNSNSHRQPLSSSHPRWRPREMHGVRRRGRRRGRRLSSAERRAHEQARERSKHAEANRTGAEAKLFCRECREGEAFRMGRGKGARQPPTLRGLPPLKVSNAKKIVFFSNDACHPCAGAMLIFSVSFQV